MLWASTHRRLVSATTIAIIAVFMLPMAISFAINMGAGNVANTDGDGLNLRSQPSLSASIVTTMPEGASVEVIAVGIFAEGREWARLRYQGLEGYSVVIYLQNSASQPQQPGSQPPAQQAPPATGGVSDYQAVIVGTGGDGVNVRTGPGTTNAVVTGLPEGATVPLLSGPALDPTDNVWYEVDAYGTNGWVIGLYLTVVENPGLPVPTPKPVYTPPPPPQNVAADFIGQAIVDEALRHMGVPYVWGGTTPAGFDCSGYTYYVINAVLGNNFSRSIWDQIASGVHVDAANLMPGDLVFFQNTYMPGLSHVGIYLGNGLFVNSGGEIDDVAVSSLWDGYWGPRFLEARRIR